MPRSTPTSESAAIGIRVQQEHTRKGLTWEQLAQMMDMSVWYMNERRPKELSCSLSPHKNKEPKAIIIITLDSF